MERIKKIRIRNVTGLRHVGLFDRIDGRRDYRANQVCDVEGGVTTPRIIQKCRSCDQFTNEIYLYAVEELKSIYTDIAICVEEFRYFDPDSGSDTAKSHGTGEESQRQNAARAAKRSAKTQRRKDLVLHLAELRQNCRNIDEVLRHNIDRARSTLRAHVESYWSGVLRGAVNERLPVSPIMVEEDLSGRPTYLEHQRRIEELLNEVFEGGEAA